ncbi:MAG: TIGR02584 family CRISPR-associated protein [Methanobacteriota archaeon]|nr:MAG: TIGR02584 family CRISPR-associated protein [Euryarchaeota archaeon]
MSNRQRHVLIALLGRTPPILTEMIYALCVKQGIPLEEVVVITTEEGRQLAMEKLLHPGEGWFYKLQAEYPEHCRSISFSSRHIRVARDGLMPISDVRTVEHSESFLELIMRVVWEKTSQPDTVLHCSLAGGRKTMSTYLALVMQLLARPQDKLYHVLVDPPELENRPDFYFPRREEMLQEKVRIDLIEIPFIRLRERIRIDRMAAPVGYRQLLEWVQRDLNYSPNLPQLIIDPQKRRLIIGDREIRLQPQRFCLYWYFADRSRRRPEHVPVEDYPAYFEYPQSPYFSSEMRDGLRKRLDSLDPTGRMRQRFEEKVLEHNMLPMNWVLQAISKINNQLRMEFPDAYALPFYLISAEGRRGNRCYGIKLDGRKIVTPDSPGLELEK